MRKSRETTDGKTDGKKGTWEACLVPGLSAVTVIFSYDNFQGAFHGQEFVTGVIQVAIFVLYILLRLIDFDKYWEKIQMYKQYGDTTVIVIMAYVLLLDISMGYFWLVMFPASVIYALPLYMERCTPGEHGKLADKSCSTTKQSERFFSAMTELFIPFAVLLAMAQLDDKAAERFVISQFLVFLSTTLGAVTYMMMSPPAGSMRLAPGSDLLHKAFLILLLVTAHTVAAEALGEQVIRACMPELVPVVLWFSVHLDRNSPVISVDKVTKLRKIIIVAVALVGGPLLAYVANSKDEFFLARCTGIMMSSGVSGLLTCYIVFMLRQWPRRQQADAGSSEEIVQSKQVSAGTLEQTVKSTEQATGSAEKNAQSYLKAAGLPKEIMQSKNQSAASSDGTSQSSGAASTSEEAVDVLLLEIWAVLLLTVAAVLLLVIKPLDRKLLVSKNGRWLLYTL